MKFELEVLNEDKVRLKLVRMGENANDPKPVFTKVAKLFEMGHRRQVLSRGAYLGTPWPSLASETVARKGNDEPLRATGALLSSLSGGKGKVRRVAKTKVTVGTKDFKARFHQAGTSRGVPARPVVGIHPSTRRLALRMLEEHLTREL